MKQKEESLKNVTVYVVYLFIFWGLYRLLIKLPVEIEEFLIKPLFWLVPIYFFLKKEKKGVSSLGITSKNLFPSLYLALFLGVIFALEGVMINFFKYQALDFRAELGKNPFMIALILSFITAVSEEISFRGYVYGRLESVMKNPLSANIVSSVAWSLVHIPVAIFWWELSIVQTLGYLILIFIFGVGSAFVYTRTKNIFSSILLHVFWEWPILLFR